MPSHVFRMSQKQEKPRSETMSKVQKDKLLKLMAYPSYREYANIQACTKHRDEIEAFWTRVSTVLHQLPGGTKPWHKWMRTWNDCCNYAIKKAQASLPHTLSGSPDGEVNYTTKNPECDTIMNIIGWEAAFSGAAGSDEDRYEESGTSPLSTPVAPKRPRVSISPLGRRSSSPMPRSDSPFSAASQSPAAQQLSSSTANDISELTSEITRLSEVVERSTNLVLELQRTLENSIVQVLDAPINADEILNELGAGQPQDVEEQEQEFL